jgi:hypothetical protein
MFFHNIIYFLKIITLYIMLKNPPHHAGLQTRTPLPFLKLPGVRPLACSHVHFYIDSIDIKLASAKPINFGSECAHPTAASIHQNRGVVFAAQKS